MSMADRLREAISETERLAQRTLNGPFEGMRAGVFTDHHESPPAKGTAVRVSILPLGWDDGPGSPIFIAYDPATVLRRCAADRKLLDLYDERIGTLDRNVGYTDEAIWYAMTKVVDALAEAYGITEVSDTLST